MQDEHKTKEQLVIELSAEIMLGKTDYNLFPAAIADNTSALKGNTLTRRLRRPSRGCGKPSKTSR